MFDHVSGDTNRHINTSVRPRPTDWQIAIQDGSEPACAFLDFYQRWLLDRGLAHGSRARQLFVQDRPELFGRQGSVTLNGYERWLLRSRRPDSPRAFADFAQHRYSRWLLRNRHAGPNDCHDSAARPAAGECPAESHPVPGPVH